MTRNGSFDVSRTRPNVLLITTDTQRCDTLRCMGNPHAISPHIDRLAADGVMFSDAYTAAPVCLPARCSLLTGVHTHVHGAIENGITPREYLPVFPNLLREAGYKTILVGKSHVETLQPAYDRICGIVGEKGNQEPDPYTAFLATLGHRQDGNHDALPDGPHMESFLVDQTIEAIRATRAETDAPFFAHCSLLSPHGPVDPPAPWDTLYDDVPLPEINVQPGETDEHPHLLRDVFRLREHSAEFYDNGVPDRAGIDAFRRAYYGLAAFCDAQIGRLLAWLDASGLRQSTLVIFTSDHGTQMFDHGFDNKHCYFDASWRIPFILRLPGTLPAGETRTMASWIDIAPTILAAAGLDAPSMQGYDLFTPLARNQAPPRAAAASTLYTSSAIVSQSWKYERYFNPPECRLYDRLGDPEEQHSIHDEPEYDEIRIALEHALLEWRAASLDVAFLQQGTRHGGPIASEIAKTTARLSGNVAEQQLNRRIADLETRTGSRKESIVWQ